MRNQISEIVLAALVEFKTTYDKHIPLEQGESIALFGREGVLNSLALVSLIVMVEQALEDRMNLSLILADERAMSQRSSPFRTAASLIDYILALVQEDIEACANPSLS